MNRTWESPFRYIVMTVLLVLFVWLLWYIREIFQPLLTAALIAYFLSPGVNFLQTRFHMRRKPAATIVYVSTLALLIILSVTIVPVIFNQVKSISEDFRQALSSLETLLGAPLQLGSFSLDLRLLSPALQTMFSGGGYAPQLQQALQFLQVTSRGFLWTLVILVSAYYLMTEWDRLRDWLIKLAPHHEQDDLNRLYQEIRAVWVGYLGGQIRLIVILALIYMAAWEAIGLPGALPLGFLAGLLNLLPEVGPAAIAILAGLVAYLEGSSYLPLSPLLFSALTLGLYLLLNTFKTVWLQPRILGHSVLMHEGIVFIAIVAAVVLQGVLGVLIVVPLLATIIVVGKYIRRRLLGMTPFDDGESPLHFADEKPASPPDPEPAAPSKTKSTPKRTPAQKKTSK